MSYIDDLVSKAREAVIKKALASYPVPRNDAERTEDRMVMWMDRSEFTVYDKKGRVVR